MQVSNKFTRKIISQIITVYQWVLEINLEDIWVQLTIKQNKDPDDMLDVVNAKLIDVCDEYLKWKNIWLDKYQLSTLCAQLITQAIDECDEPFWVSVKQTKSLVQDYLEKNKKKLEALERIKKENDEYDKQYVQAKIENKKKANRVAEASEAVEEYVEAIEEYVAVNKVQPKLQPKAQPKQQKRKRVDDTSFNFSF